MSGSEMDLSAQLRQTIARDLAEARSCAAAGEPALAARLYERCARMTDKLVKYLSTAPQRRDAREQADRYRELARRMASGATSAPDPAAGVARMEQEAAGGSDFSEYVEALIQRSSITWADIGGLEEIKREIKTAYGLAVARKPKGVNLRGWNSLLFFGPPGTGKTMLAAATSNNLQANFYNVKVSSVISKYFGESSKLVSALFRHAREQQPSVIFLDEIDALAASRDGSESGAERRVVSSMLGEMDGFESKSFSGFLLTIGATNIPWSLDEAILSRFEKRVYVPLPESPARSAIISRHIGKAGLKSNCPPADIAEKTDRFSGRELERLCKEAVNHMVLQQNPNLLEKVDAGLESIGKYELKTRELGEEDWAFAMARVSPQTDDRALEKFERWFARAE